MLVLNILKLLQEKKENSYEIRIALEPIKNQMKKSTSGSLSKNCVAAFYGFVGTFGAVAGCSAGVAGLLTGLGLFSGFAAFPFVGWCILGFAFSLALFAAVSAFEESKEMAKNELWKHTVKTSYQVLKTSNYNLAV